MLDYTPTQETDPQNAAPNSASVTRPLSHTSHASARGPCTFKINDIVDNTVGASVLPGPCRVLGFCRPDDPSLKRDEHDRAIWLIRLPRVDLKHPKRRVDYVPAPFFKSLKTLEEAHDGLAVHILNVKKAKRLPDSDLLAQAPNEAARNTLRKRLAERDARWAIIKPLLAIDATDIEGSAVRPPLELLLSPTLGSDIRKRAKAAGCTHVTVYKLLHRYWAGGGQMNALMTDYSMVGAPGVSKAQNTKLGRSTRLCAAEKGRPRGYVLDKGMGPDSEKNKNSDKRKLAQGYRLIKHGCGPFKAYLLTMSIHWAKHEILPDGTKKARLFPRWRRPTYSQFLRWGSKLNNNKSVTEQLCGARRWTQKVGSRGGSVRDQVATVLHMFVFDGTTCDVYLTSIRSRLKVLPPMTRLVIKDTYTGLVMGWYCGWLPPSPRTALLAILCAAKSKVATLARYGITITDSDWPFGLARRILADNGELKGHEAAQVGAQFGFAIELTPTFRGDKKGDMESQHHTDHKTLDDEAPGYTHGGKHTERGEEHASVSALWNLYEYMGELLRNWMDYNREVVPDLAPVDMLLRNPEIVPTRLNIFNWMREHNATSELPVDVEELEAFCLPDVKAVIRKNGLYLLGNVCGREVVLPRLRYMSEELRESGLMQQVRRLKHVIRTSVKMDRENLEVAWLPHAGGMIRLSCTARDSTLLRKFTLRDVEELMEHYTLKADLVADDDDQYALDKALRREGTTLLAEHQQRAEIEVAGVKPTKNAAKAHLRGNVTDEQALLEDLERQHGSDDVDDDPEDSSGDNADANDGDYFDGDNAASKAMEQLNEEEPV